VTFDKKLNKRERKEHDKKYHEDRAGDGAEIEEPMGETKAEIERRKSSRLEKKGEGKVDLLLPVKRK
jgi:hypothetical protein